MQPIPFSVVATTFALPAAGISAIALDPLWSVALLVVSPVITVWMVVDVLRERGDPVRTFASGEEWGYQDRPELRGGAIDCATGYERGDR